MITVTVEVPNNKVSDLIRQSLQISLRSTVFCDMDKSIMSALLNQPDAYSILKSNEEVAKIIVDQYSSKDEMDNKKIKSIKALRAITGMGLKESKELIEQEMEKVAPKRWPPSQSLPVRDPPAPE